MRLFGINSLAIGLHIVVRHGCAVRLSDGCLSSLWVSSCIAGQDLITEHDVIQGSDIPRIQAKYVRLISITSSFHFSNFRVKETSIIQKSFSKMSFVDNLI